MQKKPDERSQPSVPSAWFLAGIVRLNGCGCASSFARFIPRGVYDASERGLTRSIPLVQPLPNVVNERRGSSEIIDCHKAWCLTSFKRKFV